MTQIVSTLASLLQGAWHPGCTPASQSALYPLLTDMFQLDLLQELVLLLDPDLATFLTVFGPLHWCSTAQWPTSWSHPTTGLLTLASFLFLTLFLVEDLAMADQFLKGETWCTFIVSLLRNWSATAGSHSRVGKRKRPRKERLTTSAPPAGQGQQDRGWMRPGGWPLPLGEIPSWSSVLSAWTETTVETGSWAGADQLGAGGLLLAVLPSAVRTQ